MPDSLVAAPVVVIVNEARDSVPQSGYVILRVQVDVFPLDGPPEAFYPDVVQAPSPAVHANFDSIRPAGIQPFFAGVLGTLVGVDNFRCSIISVH